MDHVTWRYAETAEERHAHHSATLSDQSQLSGYSGPAILDLSHYAVRALERRDSQMPAIAINWTGDDQDTWQERLSTRAAQARRVPHVLREHLPQRLAAAIGSELHVSEKNCADLTKKERALLIEALVAYKLPYNGHQGCVCCADECCRLVSTRLTCGRPARLTARSQKICPCP
jgi:predicted flavoprotein YhiN